MAERFIYPLSESFSFLQRDPGFSSGSSAVSAAGPGSSGTGTGLAPGLPASLALSRHHLLWLGTLLPVNSAVNRGDQPCRLGWDGGGPLDEALLVQRLQKSQVNLEKRPHRAHVVLRPAQGTSICMACALQSRSCPVFLPLRPPHPSLLELLGGQTLRLPQISPCTWRGSLSKKLQADC